MDRSEQVNKTGAPDSEIPVPDWYSSKSVSCSKVNHWQIQQKRSPEWLQGIFLWNWVSYYCLTSACIWLKRSWFGISLLCHGSSPLETIFPSVLRVRPCRLSGQLINKGLLSRCMEQLPNPGLGFLVVTICNRDSVSPPILRYTTKICEIPQSDESVMQINGRITCSPRFAIGMQ